MGENAMSHAVWVIASMLLLTGVIADDAASPAAETDNALGNTFIESTKAESDIAPIADPTLGFWRDARPLWADKANRGELQERYRTEIRSRWTAKNLYFLFSCPYEELHLKPAPTPEKETFELWNWDVAEVFIGTDFQNIQRYKEFELSPQGEWIDLDIDLTKPHHEDGWVWNSGFQVAARIDPVAKIWYGAMRIPFSALQNDSPKATEMFRINFFRSQGPPSNRVSITWQPPMRDTFHAPEKFGLLRLADSKK
jgi:Carbohydrate family 9 binding domain-like